MGLYDTIYINENILQQYEIKCKNCGKLPESPFQTKDLDSYMESYYLRYENENEPMIVRLYKLDDPSDQKFWHVYTEEEIKEYHKKYEHSLLSPLYIKGDGHWLKEAYLPQNRKQRFMGELPHQYIRTYSSCKDCKSHEDWTVGWVEIQIKFTDGIVEDIKQLEMKKE